MLVEYLKVGYDSKKESRTCVGEGGYRLNIGNHGGSGDGASYFVDWKVNAEVEEAEGDKEESSSSLVVLWKPEWPFYTGPRDNALFSFGTKRLMIHARPSQVNWLCLFPP